MEFKTEDEVLRFFEEGGCLLDTETGRVYISDIGGEGERFYGIMVTDPVPEELRDDPDGAIEYALDCFPAPMSCHPKSMEFMEAPGCWFGELADAVIASPGRFI